MNAAINKIIQNEVILHIGAGTCGLSAGADKVIAAARTYQETLKPDMKIVEVGCIGLCSEEPLLDIQVPGRAKIFFSKVTAKQLTDILDAVLAGNLPATAPLGQIGLPDQKNWPDTPLLNEHPFFSPQTRRVLRNCGLIDPNTIDEYLLNDGYEALKTVLTSKTPAELCQDVLDSGLRGRGGGGFPTGKKWQFALNTKADQKYLICNADEGDPGAFMDRALIEGDPHQLLEGIAIASYAIGASKAYIYIRAEYPLAIKRLQIALADAREKGFLGENICNSGFNLDIIIKKGAGAFVCGEETALIHSIEGKRGMPRPRPPFPAVSGLHGKPSVINNVETLSNLPGLIRDGVAAFRDAGTSDSAGTKVFALSGNVRYTGLVEITMGLPLNDVVYTIGGGIPNNKAFKAVQIGGPSGGCIPASHLDTAIDYESLKTVGAMMGSGGLVVMDEDTCMIDLAKFFMDFIQRESCGKCIPCREGTRHMRAILESISRGRDSEEGLDALERIKSISLLPRLAGVIQDASLCGLGQSAPNPVLSTLRWFRDEYEAHVYERKCPAHKCQELIEYDIDAELCTGCTVCAKRCPTDAIVGERKEAHHIINDKCVACGTCIEVCKFNAISVN
jgi:NADH:ubiquinone oxidoreductase subunit F (NADH-binding)/Pyruvate/2-oxoacid:ferredoxin oxidoreductase delta subunit/(2Fe-2S) ferredoxin